MRFAMGRRRTTLLPKAPIARILADAGAKRVGEDAAEALSEQLEKEAKIIAAKAVANAQHAKRRTVNASDVKLASKQ